eukprot:TRINITY_DN2877_c0_g1_i1.p1 TRINITY_DN2877_c0_g1~~TRINITY_DN2877_c0_g1_i1.p1  ORF type:complete len:279 (-),score=69.17 TRINITY_DN2877_c0_g1_i1:1133-1969(-)
MNIQSVLQVLQSITPTQLAEEWDNVGLLVDSHNRAQSIKKVFLTIDLTENVMKEVLAEKADMVIAYHPLLFRPLKKITSSDATGRTLLALIANNIPLYSPHTAADAISGGLNDWIADGLQSDTPVISRSSITDSREKHPNAASLPENAVVGMGRIVTLASSITLEEMIVRVKRLTGLPHVRLARSANTQDITRFGVCAGAGGSLLPKCKGKVDVYITGEMSHHDVVAAVSRGTSIILTEHTNTERGWLLNYQKLIREAIGGEVDVMISRVDADPLVVV